jgi:hypothetical protein
MTTKLTSDQDALIHTALWEAMRQIKEGKAGAMADLEKVFRMALIDDPDLFKVLRSYADDADEREPPGQQ